MQLKGFLGGSTVYRCKYLRVRNYEDHKHVGKVAESISRQKARRWASEVGV